MLRPERIAMVEEVVSQAEASAAYYGGDGATLCAAIAVLATARCCQLRLPRGGPARAAAALGLVSVLLSLPWRIRHYHLRALAAFACFWTCPSKLLLLLLCCDRPLDYLPPSAGFLYFALVCTLPVRVSSSASAMKASSSSPSLSLSSSSPPNSPSSSVMIHYPFIAAPAKLLAFISILNLYSFRPYLSLCVIYALYCLHIYLGIELIFGSIATLLSVLFRVHCDPPSRNPLLSPSLSEFWGRRWNIVVTATLRATVYNPILHWFTSTGDRRALSCHGSTRNSNPGHGIDPSNYSSNSSHGSIISRHGDSISSLSCSDHMDNHGISNSDHINNNSITSSHGASTSSHGISNSDRIPSHGSNNSDDINNNSSHVDGTPSRDREHVPTVSLKASEVVASRTPNGNSKQFANQKPPLMARSIATMATFLVSGLLHELIFLCVNNGDITQATGEVTAFFLLHGLATCAEICLRRAWPSRLRVPWLISVALTMGFLYFTAVWLFLPPLTRGGADLHTIAEYHQLQKAIVALVRESIKR